MYQIAKTDRELISDTKELVDVLTESFRAEERRAAAEASQAVDRQFASLNIRASAPSQFPHNRPMTSGMDYLLSPPVTNYQSPGAPRIAAARSLNDLRAASNIMQVAQQQVWNQQNQGVFMANQVLTAHNRLAAQVVINESARRGAEAISSAIW